MDAFKAVILSDSATGLSWVAFIDSYFRSTKLASFVSNKDRWADTREKLLSSSDKLDKECWKESLEEEKELEEEVERDLELELELELEEEKEEVTMVFGTIVVAEMLTADVLWEDNAPWERRTGEEGQESIWEINVVAK